jgi:leucyl/phenylalanyl-tRNA--protein transferase
MTEVYLNIDKILETGNEIFPAADTADDEGLVASGGTLSIEMLVMGYCLGMFPWYNQGDPILWWSPDPRMIFRPEKIKISRSLNKTIESSAFSVSFDTAFGEVIQNCAGIKRHGQRGTWITKEMKAAYMEMHKAGYAHSVETWYGNELVGGLYGISIGRAFFGESMFHKESDASKLAFFHLAKRLMEWGFDFIDGQVPNPHLISLGAVNISRNEFLPILNKAIRGKTLLGKWTHSGNPKL